jgi:hypothetical protein
MMMPLRIRKVALTAHVTFSVGSLGAVACFLALALVGLNNPDPQTVQAVYTSMDLATRLVIVPLVLISLVTGLVQSLGTHWGLFRHYWVVLKLAVSVVVLTVLLMQMDLIASVADKSAKAALSTNELRQARISLAIHAAGGLLALLVPAALSVFKPRGLTRYGWRKQHQESASA